MKIEDLNLAIVDVETTGMSAPFDRIIEIAVLTVDKGTVVNTYSKLVDPETTISYHIEKLTGITNRELRHAATFSDLKDEILDLFDGRIFVAHSARFDYGFLRKEFERFGIDFSVKTLCTARLSRMLFPEYRRHGLDSLIGRFGFQCERRHRALDDALVLWHFLQAVQDQVGETEVGEALSNILKSPTIPAHIDRSVVQSLPERPGIYEFFGADKAMLYVGKSINIRSRVLSHFSSDRNSAKEMALSRQVMDIRAIETSGELGALLLELDIIRKFAPLYNRHANGRGKPFVAKKALTENGYLTVSVSRSNLLSPSELPDIVALFRSQKQAKDVLWSMVKEKHLCPRLMGLEKGDGQCQYQELNICRGACTGAERPEAYNIRLIGAFNGHGIEPWPFTGPIAVEERNGAGNSGEVFIIDQWCFLGSVHFDENGTGEFRPTGGHFDYHVYKVLASHLLRSRKSSRVRQVTRRELTQLTNSHF